MGQQYHLPLPRREAMGLEDFLPASGNEEAVLWLIHRSPDQWSAHTMVLWGPEGTGKTHLLKIWSARTGGMEIQAGDAALLTAIVEGHAPAKAFTLDNAEAVAGNKVAEEWLQHFFNATKAAGLPVLLTARRPPAQWGLTLRDIETRLKSCPAVALKEPDDDLMSGLLLKLFADRQLLVETGVVEYLAQRTSRTGRAVRELVETLDAASLETGRKISIPFAQKLLVQDEPEAEDNQHEDAECNPV